MIDVLAVLCLRTVRNLTVIVVNCAIHKQSRSSTTVTTSTTQQASTVDHDDDDDNDDNQAAAAAEIARKLRDDPMDCADIESIHENEF